jgi:hypothetical protein
MFHRYQIYGLNIASELACPELLVPLSAAPVDCHWRLARLDADLAQAGFVTARVQIAPGVYQFLIKGVVRYRVQGGEQILIDPVPGADDGDIRLWLLGTALGALLHQRGLLPLHVSALALDGAACAFGGDSGAGKSTLAAALHRRGLPLLTDDVGLAVPAAEAVRFYPGFPRIKLWRDALDHFGLDHRALIPDQTRTNKFHLRLDDGFQAAPLPLRRLYILERADDDAIRIAPVHGHVAIDLIRAHTYRAGLVHRLGRAGEHLRACGQVAQRVRVFRFHRPWRLDRLEASVDALLAHRQGD